MNRGRGLFIAVLLAVVAIAAWRLPLGAWTIALAEQARATGTRGVGLFFLAYIASTIAVLPGSLLTLAAGFAYGPVWGLAIASPASVAGATCAFLVGRTLARDWASRKIGTAPRMRALDAAVEREGLKLVLLLRLSPLFPFNVLNYALSLTRVRLSQYVIGSAVGMLPGTLLYVYLGSLATAAAELSSASRDGGAARNALFLAGFAATVAVVVVGTRAARRALDAELESTA
jgi:uncharacterized membrane protein YdjX (TVP38/TMEM64 family)